MIDYPFVPRNMRAGAIYVYKGNVILQHETSFTGNLAKLNGGEPDANERDKT